LGRTVVEGLRAGIVTSHGASRRYGVAGLVSEPVSRSASTARHGQGPERIDAGNWG